MSVNQLVSRLALRSAATLIVMHLAIFGLIVTNSVYYDSGGFLGLLWWLGALWVLPIIGITILVVSALRIWLQHRQNREDWE